MYILHSLSAEALICRPNRIKRFGRAGLEVIIDQVRNLGFGGVDFNRRPAELIAQDDRESDIGEDAGGANTEDDIEAGVESRVQAIQFFGVQELAKQGHVWPEHGVAFGTVRRDLHLVEVVGRACICA